MKEQEQLVFQIAEKEISALRFRAYWEGLATGIGFLMLVFLMRDSFGNIFGIQFDEFVQANYILLLILAVALMLSSTVVSIIANRRFRKKRLEAIRERA